MNKLIQQPKMRILRMGEIERSPLPCRSPRIRGPLSAAKQIRCLPEQHCSTRAVQMQRLSPGHVTCALYKVVLFYCKFLFQLLDYIILVVYVTDNFIRGTCH